MKNTRRKELDRITEKIKELKKGIQDLRNARENIIKYKSKIHLFFIHLIGRIIDIICWNTISVEFIYDSPDGRDQHYILCRMRVPPRKGNGFFLMDFVSYNKKRKMSDDEIDCITDEYMHVDFINWTKHMGRLVCVVFCGYGGE